MQRHLLREGTSSWPISSSESDVRDALFGCVSLAWLSVLCNLSRSDHMVLITCFPSGYTPVGTDCPDALSSPCLLIPTWQLDKTNRVTRNEPKIHVICYIILTRQFSPLSLVTYCQNTLSFKSVWSVFLILVFLYFLWVWQADDRFVCFGAKPNKDLSPRSSTWPEVGKGARERVGRRNPLGRSWRRVTQRGSRHWTAEETSRHEIGSRSSEGRPVKMSQHSSWLCGNFNARQR